MYSKNEGKILIHYGTPRHSGRYPWGSGGNPYQRTGMVYSNLEYLNKKGITDVKEQARTLGITTRELKAYKSEAHQERNRIAADYANQLLEEQQRNGGKKNVSEIARRMSERKVGGKDHWNESSVRDLLKDNYVAKNSVYQGTADMLRDAVNTKSYIDIGKGVAQRLDITDSRLDAAVGILKNEGYEVLKIKVDQLGSSPGNKTEMKVLCKPGTTKQELYKNKDKIDLVEGVTTKVDGTTALGIKPPVNVDSKRILVRYAEDGGVDKDGVIELSRNAPDLSLGNSNYAQVRVAVDGTHYLKGMAMYADDIPKGYDIVFNTNKKKGTPMMGDPDNTVLKNMKGDEDNPFGATVRQKEYKDKDGTVKQSPLNIVNEEGDWDKWSKTISSQVLSKQDPSLAKRQLDIAYYQSRAEFDDIKSLTNPVVKKHLLDKFADGCDSDAVHLKAAALPGQASRVILPFPKMNKNEIYAPDLNNGETVVLIRYPHGGKFEIPTLKVNNKNRIAQKTLGAATDAVGIHPSVAERLSGADFDGDTVLVIPVKKANGHKIVNIQTQDPLPGLKGFDPKQYKLPETAPKMSPKTKQTEMGKISNLITDMTLLGAPPEDLERAVKHSMVVIDAEKHHLDYKKSAEDNRIDELKLKYRGSTNAGASTLISRAKSQVRGIPDRKEINPQFNKDGSLKNMTKAQYEDWKNGFRVYENTGRTYSKASTKKDGTVEWTNAEADIKSTKMFEARDANELLSSNPKPIEKVYARYANQMKAMANEARKESRSIEMPRRNPSAAKTYAKEVESLKKDLKVAMSNKPLERQALIKAGIKYRAMIKENPDMDSDERKRARSQALSGARAQVGKTVNTDDNRTYKIPVTDKQWKAIQADAVSPTVLREVLNNTNVDRLKELAMPKKAKTSLTPSKKALIKALVNGGATQKEIADKLGIGLGTVKSAING